MKIVINALSARLGGGRTYLKNLLAHLPEQPDIDFLIFAPASLPLPEDPRIRRGVTQWPIDNPLLRTLWERFALPRILIAENADALFCPGGVVASRVPAGCKVVTMFRNMIPFDPDAVARIPIGLQRLRNWILKRVMLHSMQNADLTIFISDHARRVIEAQAPIRNAVTIPHGINSAFRTHDLQLRRPEWVPAKDYLLYVSRFDVYKHQYEVAVAFSALPPDILCRYKLLFVGETDDVLTRRVREVAVSAALEDRILVLGPIAYNDLPAAYHHATINIFASSCENCPNILLEALGSGRPLLSSNIAPMPEFGADAVGYFIPTDSDSIRDAILMVLRDEARQNQLAAAAARRSDDYDWVTTARETWRHISALLPQQTQS